MCDRNIYGVLLPLAQWEGRSNAPMTNQKKDGAARAFGIFAETRKEQCVQKKVKMKVAQSPCLTLYDHGLLQSMEFFKAEY